MKKSLLLLCLLLTSLGCIAHDFKVDGIYYQITSSTAPLTVAVSYRGSSYSSYSNEYTGDVTIPDSVTYSGKTYSVTSIGDYAFRGCSSLTSVTIGNSVTSIGQSAFRDCSEITSLTIPENVILISAGAFGGCIKLKEVTICDGESGLSFRNTTLPFENCPLETIYIGRNIGNPFLKVSYSNSTNTYTYTYHAPKSISYVRFGEYVTGIPGYLLYGCDNLTSLIIPDRVQAIPEYMCYGCTRLSKLSLGTGVKSIGYRAFYGCLVTKIDCYAEFPPGCDTSAFTVTTSNCRLCVPEESIDLYKVHPYWCDFFIEAQPTPVSSIALNYNTYALKSIGQSIQLTVTILPADATDKTVTWTSSDETVCTVGNSGLVVATGAGTATITATTTDGGLTATCTITVTKPVTGITLNHSEYTLNGIGKSFLLTATVMPDDATEKSVTWKSYNESVCIVTDGMVVSVGFGSTVVTATTTDGGQMAFCLVMVKQGIPGDLNRDGKLGLIDLQILTQILVGREKNYNFYNADVNEDGRLSLADLTRLVNLLQ